MLSPLVYKLKTAFKGGEQIFSGDRITKNKRLFKDAYFDVTDINHEATREIIESLEALEKMKTRTDILNAHYLQYPRANKNYWSVKQSYDDTLKAALDKLKED